MPKFLEDKLKQQYGADSPMVYKVLNSIGAMHGNKETPKGAAMEAKHERHIHGASTHEVVYSAEPSDIREVNMSDYGKDFEPRQYRDGIVGMEPFSHEKDAVKYGRVFQPGQISNPTD